MMRVSHRQPASPLARLGRLLLLAAVLLSSLGGLAAPRPAAASEPGALITYGAAGFSPAELTVAPGTTVTWRNTAAAPLGLRSGLPSQLFLPLLAQPGGQAAAAAPPPPAALAEALALEATIAPGGEFSATFDQEGSYSFHAFGTSFTGGVNVAVGDIDAPLDCADAPPADGAADSQLPGLLYATAADRTLLRWYWADCTSAEFAVYRSVDGGPEQLVATVTPVTDPAAAEALLNTTDPRWPDLASKFDGRLLSADDLTTEQLYHYLYTNGLAGVHLSNQYYPLALMLGWGYLDTDITPGASYSYRVRPAGAADDLGSVSLVAGQPTPLPVPTGLQAGALDTRPRAGDWSEAQRNRRYDGRIYLSWDLAEDAAVAAAMPIGYDVFRATEVSPEGAILAAEKVVPLDSDDPDALVVPGPTSANEEGADYLFAYAPGDYADHTFCVAPRDLLSQAISWPAGAARCSAPLTVAAEDYQPPAAPQDVRAAALANSAQVTVRWSHAAPADVNRFIIQRTQEMHCAPGDCWDEVGTVAGNATSWVDAAGPCANDPEAHAGCWYRVVARDAAGNRSPPSQAVYALNRDTEAPLQLDIKQDDDCATPGAGLLGCVDIGSDAESIRVNCVLTPGGDELFIAEIGPDQYADLDLAALIRGVYTPPLHLAKVECRLIMADEYGNLSDIDASPVIPVVVPGDSADQLARPVISAIETVQDPGGDWGATLHWEMPAHPMLAQFAVDRAVEGGASIQVALLDGSVRSFEDSGLDVGERYTYTVRALAASPEVNDTQSEPRSHRLLPAEERQLVELPWLFNTPQRSAATATATLQVSAAALGDGRPIHYAVYRSQRQNSDFTQITPVLQTSSATIFYQDDQSQQACYYYALVTFSPRTGEPTGYAAPRQPGLCLLGEQTTYTPGPDLPAPPPPSPLCAPAQHSLDPGYEFRFGGGMRVVVESLSDNQTGPARVGGGGWLMLETAEETIPAPMNFSSLTVDSTGRVCSGTASVDLSSLPGGGLVMEAPGGWTYRLRTITLQPWSAASNTALATLDLYSGGAFTNFDGVNGNAARIELQGAQLLSSLRFSYQQNFARLAGHGCATPQAAFRLETLPLDVIPTGLVSIDEQQIAIGAACTRYVDRYNDTFGPMALPPNLGAIPLRLLNDGYLAAPLTGSAVSLTPAGLDGSFSTAADLEWHTAYPYGARVRVDGGLSLSIADGQIVSGSTGPGEVFASYHQTVDGDDTATIESSFSGLTIGSRGDLSANVSLGAISWDAFAMPAAAPNSWALYVGALTTPGRPAGHDADGIAQAIMWRPSPAPPSPVALPDGTALQGLIEPGFNRRQPAASLRWENCGDTATFGNVALDTYLRLGGITQRHIPLYDPGSQLEVHGYRFIPEQFSLQFLDNALQETTISGAVDLPFPSNIEVPLVDIWLTADADDPAAGEAACIGGGRVPAEAQAQTLDYWDVSTRLARAEFRQGPAATVLWFLGELRDLPHLRDGEGSAILPAELAFDPDGNFHKDERNGPKYDRPDYRLQGFPYLLERLELSEWNGPGDVEEPLWAQDASALPAPADNVWASSGFVGLRGVPVAPYFGPIMIDTPDPDDHQIALLAWAPNLTGFASQPRVSKEWVKLARVNITFDYDRLVHTYDQGAGVGRFVGFKTYRFLPDGHGLNIPIPEELQQYDIGDPFQVLQLDTATVIEPGRTGVHLGLSSGVAALRALAPNGLTPMPSQGTLDSWAIRMGVNDTARPVYIAQLANAWGQNGFAYSQATEALDALMLDQLIDQNYVGGRTQGLLAARGVLIRRLRGVIEVEGEGLETQFRRFRLSTQVEITGRDQDPADFVPIPENPVLAEEPPLFYAERMTLSIERHGDFMIVGEDVQSSQFGDELESFDATLVINATKPQFEGGLTLYGLKAGSVEIDNGSAVLGIGADLNYLGLSFDGRLGVSAASDAPGGEGVVDSEIEIGGDLLAGVINTDSEVLKNNFADAMAEIATDLGDEELERMAGFYLRAYAGEIPIIGNGCTLNLKGDAEVAFWYWKLAGGANYGGLLKPAVYGEVLCTVQARGALSLEYQNSAGQDRFSGAGYIAGGVGSCEPGDWGEWDERWWGDNACLQAGAGLDVDYASGDGWSADYGFDYERLFGGD